MAVSRVCDRDHRRTAVIGRSATSPPTSTPAKTSCGWCTPTRGPVDRLRPSAPAGDGLMNRRDAADLAGTRSRRLHGVRHPRMGGDRPERRSSVGRRRFAGLVARPWRGRGDGAGPRGDRYRQSRCPVCPRGAGRHGCRASRAATDVGCRAESCLAGMRAGHALRGDGTRPAAASAARRLGDVGGGWAFPSGHTTTAAPTAGLLIIALSLRVPRGATVLRVVVVCWCVLVGLSRVHLGVHWFSDVIGGWLFATGWLGVSLYGMARWFPSLFVSGSLPTAEDPAEDHAPQDLGRRG
ncbi:phosphatase PAP2 family protein [Streptomyces sp. NPDC017673]|uniref:phosphatase PAP2 family protein n=1 Tax=unclassified Streptomyces TaxID=2593676 RepID=UPI0037B31F21